MLMRPSRKKWGISEYLDVRLEQDLKLSKCVDLYVDICG